ncbi:PH domain-containing protein [Mycobacterium koreense]|uniref:Low molecular weight protein antigen 6 PH domain-containing protein n=1 Tax=Mycolicibacillus koreensis TaxID=1069220 RepID=A0AA91PDI3_9MYCO|nr:PH domain-containing protein [Mycolicibacillus koreensis]MCV7247173.1 PH domain-containing protein [Mycolicibacillus koreensis]OSC33156.1 hypothetical protein B8W67_12325 [Mycolicibacillus koreensis]
MSAAVRQWSPPPAGIAGAGLAGMILLVVGLAVVTDPPGRILVTLAGAGLAVFAAVSWRARPRLAVDDGALVVRGWLRVHRVPRTEITLIRVTEFARIGRTTRLLEIEATQDRLWVLSRWDLGTDPVAVLDALTDAGYAGAGS